MARLNPYNPSAGRFKKTHVDPQGRRYVHSRWYPVTLAQAQYCANVRQRNNDPNAQMAFTVARNMADAIRIEDAEAQAKEHITRQVVGHDAMTLEDMREFLKQRRDDADRSHRADEIFTTPDDAIENYADAVETLYDNQLEAAERKGVVMSDVAGESQQKGRNRRGSRGGRKKQVRKSSAPADAGVMTVEQMRAHVARDKPDDDEDADQEEQDGVLLGQKELQVDKNDRVVATDRAGKATANDFGKTWDSDDSGG